MINRFCVEHAGRPGRRWPVFATLVADGGAAVAGPQEPIRLARPQNGVVGGAQGHVPHRRIVQADAQEAAAAGQIRSVPVRFQVRGTLDGRVPADCAAESHAVIRPGRALQYRVGFEFCPLLHCCLALPSHGFKVAGIPGHQK